MVGEYRPLTHYQMTNFRLFQTEFADDNFKFDENGRKLSKQVENTEGKGEIARYEQFLLFPQCFQKASFPETSKGVIVWEWVKTITKSVDTDQKNAAFDQQVYTKYQLGIPLATNLLLLDSGYGTHDLITGPGKSVNLIFPRPILVSRLLDFAESLYHFD